MTTDLINDYAAPWVFIIDTNQYAGNFEREMCAYCTGMIGQCEVGEEMVALFEEDFKLEADKYHEDNPFMDYVNLWVMDDHGCGRPTSIWRSSRGADYNSVAIFFHQEPTEEHIKIIKKRAQNFAYILPIKPYCGKISKVLAIMEFKLLKKEVTVSEVARVWTFSWVGNLIGSLGLAYLVVASGALSQAAIFIEKVSLAKMTMPAYQLFLRGVLCNWLVCLALWTSSRTKSDPTKCILIFWCLFAFIACGYEHSIANMTLLSMSLFTPHSIAINWLGFFRNMFFVTLGNIIGGSFFVGTLYCVATYKERK